MSAARCDGFGYVEVILATALLATMLIPALDAMRGALDTVAAPAKERVELLRVASSLEEALAQPSAVLVGLAADPARAAALAAAVPGSPDCVLTVARSADEVAKSTAAGPLRVTARMAGSRYFLSGLVPE